MSRMLTLPFVAWLLTLAVWGGMTNSTMAADSDEEVIAEINRLIRSTWEANEISPSERTTDGEFARRVSLDIVGHIPSLEVLTAFLEDESPNKRAIFVEKLLDDPDYIKNWTNIWGNLLIGRGGNNRQGSRAQLEKWLRDSLYRNEGYEKFVYGLISAEGEGTENGAVNFLSAHLNDGAVPATSITARLFLGMQVQCTQCHNHPFNDWKQSQFWGMNAFFRGTRRQGRGDEMYLSDDPAVGLVFFEKRNGLQEAVERRFVDGTRLDLDPMAKPRAQLATLVTDPEKPFMTRTQVNRMWGHFFGFGFTRPVDDMGPHNPPSHPELLDYLATEFLRAGYDNKRLIRWITGSEAYQLSSRFGELNINDDPTAGNLPLFSRMYVKSFTAEQLYDSLIIATEAHKTNRNAEAAENQRRQWLTQFIRTFGTDENDESTSFNGTIPQALVMMNGDLTSSATSDARGGFLRQVLEAPSGNVLVTKSKPRGNRPRKTAPKLKGSQLQGRIETLYLTALARKPTEGELEKLNQVFQESGTRDPIVGLQDLFWALLNSNEFIMNY